MESSSNVRAHRSPSSFLLPKYHDCCHHPSPSPPFNMTTSLRSSADPTLLRSLRTSRPSLPCPPKFSRSYNSYSRTTSSPFVRFFPLVGLLPIPFIIYYRTTSVDLDSEQEPRSGGNEKVISLEELKTHNSIKDGLWVAIKGDVWE